MILNKKDKKTYNFKTLRKSLNTLMSSKEVRNKIIQSLEMNIVKVV